MRLFFLRNRRRYFILFFNLLFSMRSLDESRKKHFIYDKDIGKHETGYSFLSFSYFDIQKSTKSAFRTEFLEENVKKKRLTHKWRGERKQSTSQFCSRYGNGSPLFFFFTYLKFGMAMDEFFFSHLKLIFSQSPKMNKNLKDLYPMRYSHTHTPYEPWKQRQHTML